jgi:PBP1b-binding outer membrane lipoprotein LpoB
MTKYKSKMRKVFLMVVLGLFISSCTTNWEYKVVTVKGTEKEASKFDPKEFETPIIPNKTFKVKIESKQLHTTKNKRH